MVCIVVKTFVFLYIIKLLRNSFLVLKVQLLCKTNLVHYDKFTRQNSKTSKHWTFFYTSNKMISSVKVWLSILIFWIIFVKFLIKVKKWYLKMYSRDSSIYFHLSWKFSDKKNLKKIKTGWNQILVIISSFLRLLVNKKLFEFSQFL